MTPELIISGISLLALGCATVVFDRRRMKVPANAGLGFARNGSMALFFVAMLQMLQYGNILPYWLRMSGGFIIAQISLLVFGVPILLMGLSRWRGFLAANHHTDSKTPQLSDVAVAPLMPQTHLAMYLSELSHNIAHEFAGLLNADATIILEEGVPRPLGLSAEVRFGICNSILEQCRQWYLAEGLDSAIASARPDVTLSAIDADGRRVVLLAWLAKTHGKTQEMGTVNGKELAPLQSFHPAYLDLLWRLRVAELSVAQLRTMSQESGVPLVTESKRISLIETPSVAVAVAPRRTMRLVRPAENVSHELSQRLRESLILGRTRAREVVARLDEQAREAR